MAVRAPSESTVRAARGDEEEERVPERSSNGEEAAPDGATGPFEVPEEALPCEAPRAAFGPCPVACSTLCACAPWRNCAKAASARVADRLPPAGAGGAGGARGAVVVVVVVVVGEGAPGKRAEEASLSAFALSLSLFSSFSFSFSFSVSLSASAAAAAAAARAARSARATMVRASSIVESSERRLGSSWAPWEEGASAGADGGAGSGPAAERPEEDSAENDVERHGGDDARGNKPPDSGTASIAAEGVSTGKAEGEGVTAAGEEAAVEATTPGAVEVVLPVAVKMAIPAAVAGEDATNAEVGSPSTLSALAAVADDEATAVEIATAVAAGDEANSAGVSMDAAEEAKTERLSMATARDEANAEGGSGTAALQRDAAATTWLGNGVPEGKEVGDGGAIGPDRVRVCGLAWATPPAAPLPIAPAALSPPAFPALFLSLSCAP